MPGGRPTKYRPNMPDRVRALLSAGYSKAACAGKLGISNETLLVWEREKPEISEAIKEGEAASQAWWEDRGRDACTNGEFNPTVWSLNMRNRFGWSDKQSHEHTGKDGGAIETKSKVLQVVGVESDE